MGRSTRKHVATGAKPPGGPRPGAGRKPGKNTLEYGEVKALAAFKLRIPEGASPELENLAGRALERIVAVMEEKVNSFQARNVLSAATRLREEACGPLTQKVQVSGLETLTDEQLEAKLRAITAKATAASGADWASIGPMDPDAPSLSKILGDDTEPTP